MRISKGDKVRRADAGPEMEVLAAGATLALCEWSVDGASKTDLFNSSELVHVTVGQQAQQPQATPAPNKDDS